MPRALAVAAALLLGAPLAALSQETTRLEEEVRVTATRIPKTTTSAGQSVTVITEERMWDRQVHESAEAIRVVPGVFVSKNGPPGSPTSVFLRGAASNQTVVLVDGVKVNDPTIGGQFNFYDLPVDNAQSIEVLRGSSSTLHGSEAIGGVVNVVTRSGMRSLGGRAALEGGYFGHARTSMAAWYGDKSAEFSGEISTASWNNDEAHNDFENESFAGRVSAATADGLHLNAVARLWKSEAEDPFDFPVGPQIERDSNIRRDRRTWLAKLELVQDATQGMGWSASASRFKVKSDFENRGDVKGDPDELKSDAEAFVQNYAGTVTFADVDPSTKSSGATALLGGEYEVEQSENETESSLGTSEIKDKVRNKALFGQIDLAFGENLNLGGGYRHDRNSIFGKSGTWSATAIMYFPEEGTRIRGNFGEGIRAPTPVEFADPFVGNEDLEEERSTSYDLGWEQELYEGDLLVSVTWFRLDTRDLIAFDPTSGTSGRLENVDRARTTGWELRGVVRASDEVDVSGFWTVQKPRNRSAKPGEED
ncbi:MAG: TonB-dependent receptor plug domain-containing protein, partial [Planctomycetota bacterium]